MKNSERAAARVSEMPQSERSLSEQYRIVAKVWVDLDGAARMLEGCKDAVLSEMVNARLTGERGVAKAEREAKASKEWRTYLEQMIKARTEANLQRAKLEYTKMRFSEWLSLDASARQEMKMTGTAR